MIIPKDILPERSLYAIGANLLTNLRTIDETEVHIDSLFERFSSNYRQDISYSYYIYALDWLYLLGLIDFGEDSLKIKKCF